MIYIAILINTMINDCIDKLEPPSVLKSNRPQLSDEWNLFYHLPQNKSWVLSSYITICGNIHELDELIAINVAVSDHIIRNCMLFLMRTGIQPVWEDVKNRSGGCFSYKVVNDSVPEVWRTLVYLLCGNTLMTNAENMKLVNGITVSPKKQFSIIKIWLRDCSLQNPDVVVDFPNLKKFGGMFRKHEPEF